MTVSKHAELGETLGGKGVRFTLSLLLHSFSPFLSSGITVIRSADAAASAIQGSQFHSVKRHGS